MLWRKMIKMASAQSFPAQGGFDNTLAEPRLGRTVYAVSAVINLLALALPITVLQVYDRVLPNAAYDTLFALTIGLILVLIADAILKYCRAYVVNWTGASHKHKLSVAALERMLTENPKSFSRTPVSEHMDRLGAITGLGDQIGVNPRIVSIDLLFIPIFALIIVVVGGPILLVPLVLFAIFGAYGLHRAKKQRAIVTERETDDARKYDFVIEVLSAIQTVKAFAMEPLMLRRFERMQSTSSATLHRMIGINSATQTFGNLYITLSTISIIAVGALLVIHERLTIGGLACCMLLSSQLLQPLLRSFSAWSTIQLLNHRRERAAEIFVEAEAADDQGGADEDAVQIEGPIAISLKNVEISHDDTTQLFKDLSLEIRAGAAVAIRGADGSGRSSLLRAIAGDIRPTAGKVEINGHAYSDRTRDALRSCIRYVSSRPTIFRGSIYDNLTLFGKTPANDALKVSTALGLNANIIRMPNGYDTMIKSAASRDIPVALLQLICVARAIAMRPSLLILDEANALLDTVHEKRLSELLLSLSGKTTIIISTHRPSFLRVASEVYDIENKNVSLAEFTAPPTPLANTGGEHGR